MKKTFTLTLDHVALLLLPCLVSLPTASQDRVSRFMVSGLFIALFLKNALVRPALNYSFAVHFHNGFKRASTSQQPLIITVAALILMITIADIKGIYTGTSHISGAAGFFIWSLSISLYCASAFIAASNDSELDSLLSAAGLGIALFIAANILAFGLGMSGVNKLSEAGQNKLLSIVGITFPRVSFPFSSGLNNFGSMAGLCVILNISRLTKEASILSKLVFAVAVAIGLVGIVLADSRGVILVLMTAMLALKLARIQALAKTLSIATPLILPFVPLIFLGILEFLNISGLSTVVMRDGDFAKRLGAASGRDVIWLAGYQSLLSPSWETLFGHGSFGQVASGITKSYSWIFSAAMGQTEATLHNATLQYLIDTGIIGCVIWLLFWRFSFSALGNRGPLSEYKSRTTSTIASMLLFLVLGGAMEVVGTAYQADLFVYLLLTASALIAATTYDTNNR